MNRYLFGFFAIVITMALSAFTLTSGTRTVKRIFSYSGDFSSNSVANPANWIYIEDYTDLSVLCSSTDKACKVIIEESYTKSSGLSYAMRTNADGLPYVILATTRQDPTSHPTIYKVTVTGSSGLAVGLSDNLKVTSQPF